MRTPLYIKFNSHWSPEGVGVAADYLAEYLRPYLTDVPGARYTVSTSREPMFSDLLTLMSLPHDWRKYRRQFHEVPHVQDNGHVLQAGDAAPVLLMGDSFCTMYTGLDGNGAPGGGLGQQLALRLGMAVQVQARASFSPTWQWLPVDGNPELLAHKRVVVWTFAARWLSLVDSAVWLDRPMLPLASQIKK